MVFDKYNIQNVLAFIVMTNCTRKITKKQRFILAHGGREFNSWSFGPTQSNRKKKTSWYVIKQVLISSRQETK